jgi:glucokinase
MGSGYGVAVILKTQLLDEPLVLGTELGHVQIPAVLEKDPQYEDERGLLQYVSNYYYEGVQMPEYEDVASGRGIVVAFKYALTKRGKEIPAEVPNAGGIAQLAKAGDEAAREAIFLAHKFFTRSAKSIATSLSCDSILLALDNQVKDLEFVESFVDLLRAEFYTWIRPEWLNGVRVYTQKESLNFNILGTDYMAHRLATKAVKK